MSLRARAAAAVASLASLASHADRSHPKTSNVTHHHEQDVPICGPPCVYGPSKN